MKTTTTKKISRSPRPFSTMIRPLSSATTTQPSCDAIHGNDPQRPLNVYVRGSRTLLIIINTTPSLTNGRLTAGTPILYVHPATSIIFRKRTLILRPCVLPRDRHPAYQDDGRDFFPSTDVDGTEDTMRMTRTRSETALLLPRLSVLCEIHECGKMNLNFVDLVLMSWRCNSLNQC